MRPFEGYDMDCAIGTSYSLSLEALLFLPLSLFFGEELDLGNRQITLQMLEALTKVPEKIRVFCQKGKIARPAFYHNILAFWEDSIEQIHMDSHLKSFHPKLWLIRYVPHQKNKPVRYKLFCTSRNLTMCRDWDMALEMEGTVVKKRKKENQPLKDFLQYLDNNWEQKTGYKILEEIMNIDFEKGADELSYHFHALGLGKNNHPLLVARPPGDTLLIMSPFLDNTTLKKYSSLYREVLLFSSSQELSRIDPSILLSIGQVYQFNPVIERNLVAVYDPETLDDHQLDTATQASMDPESHFNPGLGLHAKLYILGHDSQSSWYVGSANATDPALGRNIEFMTQVNLTSAKATPQAMLELLTDSDSGKGLFVPFGSPDILESDPDQDTELALRKLIYELCSLKVTGSVTQDRDSMYTLQYIVVTQGLNLPDNFTVQLCPLSVATRGGVLLEKHQDTYTFTKFSQIELTPFLLYSISYPDNCRKELVIHSGIQLPGNRLSKIFSSIIDSQERLLLYLAGILSREDITVIGNLTEQGSAFSINGQTAKPASRGLYEKLLLAAATDKEKIRAVTQTMKYFEEEANSGEHPVVSQELRAFLTIFESFTDDI